MPTRTSRRMFLAQSAAVTALAASGSALGAEDAPSKKIVVALMGLNGRGSDLIQAFAAQKGCEVAYVCDVDERAIAKGMKLLSDRQKGEAKGIADFRRALDDEHVDALVCAAPDHWHAPATILACSAGKHVYVEKPASHNGREGQLMLAAARKHNRVVQVGTQRRSAPGVIEAINKLHAGEIGRVLLAKGWITSTRPSIGHGHETTPPAWLNYDLWQGPAPAMPFRDNLVHYNWHWFWNWGTGELGNNGIHALDVCRWGLKVDYPRMITCGGGRFHFDDDQQTPDTMLATFDFGDRAISWEHRTWNKRGHEGESFGVAFYGEQGTMIVGEHEYRVLEMDGKVRSQAPLKVSNDSHVADFLAAIREGRRSAADVEDGVKSTTLCHLGNVAYRSQSAVKFDPAKVEIDGDAKQRALWTREYRPGWEPKV